MGDTDLEKKRRGRRPKSSMLQKAADGEQDSLPAPMDAAMAMEMETAPNGTEEAVPSGKSRARRTRMVYNAQSLEDNLEKMENDSNENIIMKLLVNPKDASHEGADAAERSPPLAFDAYEDNLYNSTYADASNALASIPTAPALHDLNSVPPATAPALKVVHLLEDFEKKNQNNEWPLSTSIHCYWCCHGFTTPPFGLPVKYYRDKFYVVGCFCSLECASAHNMHSQDGVDQILERNNLLHALSRKIEYIETVKAAPSRLALRMFGGHMSIDEFRAFCKTSKLINLNFPPMMTLTQQLEEINQCDVNQDYKYVPVDTERVNKYKEKIKLKRQKPLMNYQHTLDHVMNLKITAGNGAPDHL